MLPGSVEARANIKVTFLHDPLIKSFCVAWRLTKSLKGFAETIAAVAAIAMIESFIFVDDYASLQKRIEQVAVDVAVIQS
jgi:hypothetical protein